MAIVAIVAILLGVGFELSRRRQRFMEIATRYGRRARSVTRGTFVDGKGHSFHVEYPNPKKQHDLDLEAKYERAARYPWLPVEPGSPEPE